MTKRNTPTDWTTHYHLFKSAPIELRSYFLFALISTVLLVLELLNKDLRRAITPITGWFFSLGYMMSLASMYTLIFQDVPNKTRIRLAVIAPLVIYTLFSIYDLLKYQDYGSVNPFHISNWQPIWTIIIPTIWIGLLLSNRVTQFCKSQDISFE